MHLKLFSTLLIPFASGSLRFEVSTFEARVHPVTKRAQLTVTVHNDGSEPVDVALSFNQTFPTDATAIPTPGRRGIDLQRLRTGLQTPKVLSGALLENSGPTAPRSIIITLRSDKEEIINKGKLVVDCLREHGSDCQYTAWRSTSQCLPEVRLLRTIQVAILDYSGAFTQCTPEDIQADMDFLGKHFDIEAIQLDELDGTDPDEPNEPIDYVDVSASGDTSRSGVPTDPLFSSQFSLLQGRIAEAWAEIGQWPKHYKPLIGITDSGVWLDHPDLAENMWVNEAELHGLPGVDDDGNGYVDDIYGWVATEKGNFPMSDFSGHGTHVVGIVAAVTNNALGVSSVAGPNVKVANCRRRNAAGSGLTSHHLECHDWLLSVGARVSSNSFGTQFDSPRLPSAAEARSFDAENEAGVLSVNSAGNHGVNVGPPNESAPLFPTLTCYNWPNQLAIADLRRDDSLALHSNYGESCVELGAYGSQILSTGDPVHSSGQQYVSKSGTSMAAPYVAGVAALWLNVNPYLDAFELKRLFREAVVPLPALARPKSLFGGMPDAVKGIRLLRPEALKPADGSRWDDLRFDLKQIPAGQAVSYELEGNVADASGATLGQIVAYSVHMQNNYAIKEKIAAPVVVLHTEELNPTDAPDHSTQPDDDDKPYWKCY